jgi:hypothetical protein
MSDSQKRILQMLAEGKISVDEASTLLSLVNKESEGGEGTGGSKAGRILPKYLYVNVEPKEGHHNPGESAGRRPMADHGRVNVRIPVGLIRAGMKLKALVPPHVAEDVNQAMKKEGIAFDIRDLDEDSIEELVKALADAEINVDSAEAQVRIHAE